MARRLVVLVLAGGLLLCACGAAAPSGAPVTLRLGYFPNVTHAAAVIGVARGTYAQALGAGVTLETKTFNAGPEAVEAIYANGLDATFIGPNPAINAFIRSNGEAIRIIAGATSGGAFLVVRDGINSAADLRDTKIASPQLGNTQDVALRAWLADEGLATDAQGGGDVSILPQGNSQTLDTFISGGIDGAWVPEPWATRMIQDGGGHVLVDERDLWLGGQYVTTHLIVRTEFLTQHPDVVKRLLQGHLQATDYVNSSAAEGQATLISSITELTGSTLGLGRRRRLGQPDLHPRSDRVIAAEIGRRCLLARLPRFAGPRRHLRSGAAQRGPARGRPARDRPAMSAFAAHERMRLKAQPVVLSVRDVRKAYGPIGNHVLALESISLEVRRGEFVCLVGASGCGKSTLLNLISGLDSPTRGDITIDGRPTLLFQEAALFPWLTAGGNIDLPLRLAKAPREQRRADVQQLLQLVHLEGFGDRRPHELSGGMRQRVAVARALAQRADILLMDEPFGSLDAMTRDLLHDELERIWRETGVTIVFVTHNVREAVRLGDRIIVLTSRPGKVAEEFAVDLARPRNISGPEVAELAFIVTERLRAEVRRHADG